MKKTLKLYLFTCVLTFLSLSASSQIKVDANGKIAIGSSTVNSTYDLKLEGGIIFSNDNHIAALEITYDYYYGDCMDFSPAGHMYSFATLGEEKMWSSLNVEFVACYDLINLSDARLKENILEISSQKHGLNSLRPVSYTYKSNSAKGDPLKSKGIVSGQKHVGFLAQELSEVYPHLVHEVDSSGTLGINYIGLVPYLVKAYQEQQVLIEELQEQLNEEPQTKGASLDLDNDSKISSSLSQNVPNPFTNSTIVKYLIGTDVVNAQIMLFDMNGKWVTSYSVSPNSSELTVDGGVLQPGMYIYTLVCDNKEIDSKRMILTK